MIGNIAQFILVINTNNKLTELNQEYKEVTKKYEKLQKRSEILKEGYDFYNEIVLAAGNNVGHASSAFYVDQPVVRLRSHGRTEKIRLTTNFSGYASIKAELSNISVANFNFDQETWTSSTTLTIIPKNKGVSCITFSNNRNSQEFVVIVIVT